MESLLEPLEGMEPCWHTMSSFWSPELWDNAFLCFFFNVFIFKKFWLCWIFVAVCGFSPVVERGLLCCGAWASHWVAFLVAEHGLEVHRLQWLQHLGSAVVAHGLSCSVACGIFLDQGSNLCSLHWGFLSTGPPGKSSTVLSRHVCVNLLW